MDLYHQIKEFQDDLLGSRGYAKVSAKDIMEELEGKLDQAMYFGHKTLEPQPFQIDIQGQVKGDTVNFLLHYQYYPDKQQLKIQLLTARLGDLAETRVIRGNELPPVKAVHEILLKKQRRKAAQLITAKPSTAQGKRIG